MFYENQIKINWWELKNFGRVYYLKALHDWSCSIIFNWFTMSTNQTANLYTMMKPSNSSRRRRAGVKFFDSADWAMNGSLTEGKNHLPHAITNIADVSKKQVTPSPLDYQNAMDKESIVA